jgi:hypothetical protein
MLGGLSPARSLPRQRPTLPGPAALWGAHFPDNPQAQQPGSPRGRGGLTQQHVEVVPGLGVLRVASQDLPQGVLGAARSLPSCNSTWLRITQG